MTVFSWLGRRQTVFVTSYLLMRSIIWLSGSRYDGERVISTFMQFPDIQIMNIASVPNILLNFHTSPPGLPVVYAIFHDLFGNNWTLIAYGLTIFLGLFTGIYLINATKSLSINRFIFVLILVLIAANPIMATYEMQFYNTAWTSYLMTLIFAVVWFDKATSFFSITSVVLMLTTLSLTRATMLPVFSISMILLIFFRNKKFVLGYHKTLALTLMVALSISTLSTLQLWRVIKFDVYSFNSSAATGTLLALGSFSDLNSSDYARSDYFPYRVLDNSESFESGNPILDYTHKGNGLPNWNYRGYLEDWNLDSKNLPKILIHNPQLVAKMILRSTLIASTNPACSRVMDPNLKTEPVAQMIKIYEKVFLPIGPEINNEELYGCDYSPRLQFLYLMGLFLVTLVLMSELTKSQRRRVLSRMQIMLTAFLCFYLAMSILNGSPEVSKYRLETELVMMLMLGLYLDKAKQEKLPI